MSEFGHRFFSKKSLKKCKKNFLFLQKKGNLTQNSFFNLNYRRSLLWQEVLTK